VPGKLLTHVHTHTHIYNLNTAFHRTPLPFSFVVAVHQHHQTQKAILRTYRTRSDHRRQDITVLDAILATCASQPDFLPITIGIEHRKQHFVGAGTGLRTNNPVRELISEAHLYFSGPSRVTSLVSFGSGHPGVLALPRESGGDECNPPPTSPLEGQGPSRHDAWVKAVRGCMMDAEQTAQEMAMQMGHLGVYFRFSVEQGMQQEKSLRSENVADMGEVLVQTAAYMDTHEVSQRLDNCVESLESQLGLPTLDQLSMLLSLLSPL